MILELFAIRTTGDFREPRSIFDEGGFRKGSCVEMVTELAGKNPNVYH